MRKTWLLPLTLIFAANIVRADYTFTQKVEGGGNDGQMTLKLKAHMARADIAPQISIITNLETGDAITLQHAAKVFIKSTVFCGKAPGARRRTTSMPTTS